MSTRSPVSVFRSLPTILGEGAVWHPSRQSLFWVDIMGRKILETTLSQDSTRSRPVEALVGAVIPTAAGGLLALLQDGVHRVDLNTGRTTFFTRPAEHDATRVRFNDAKCDPRGRLWAGTMSLDESPRQGALYRITADGTSRRMREQVSISNGLAWSLDGRILYYIDSPTRAVQAFDFDPDTGELSRARIAIDLSQQQGFPDGCTIDAEGKLWIAFWDGWCVMRWDPVNARLLDTVRLPVSQVTTCTFGGPNLDTLFITTAACKLTAEQQKAQPEAGFLFAANVGTQGLPADTFDG